MANWKKMAEAFGRAVARGDRLAKGNGKGADFVDRASQGARVNKETDDAYRDGLRRGYDNWDEVREREHMKFDADALSDKEIAKREDNAFSEINERESDENLQKDFDKAFENAFKKESDWLEEGWMRDPDKKFGGMPKLSDDEYQWLGSPFMTDKADRDKYIRDKMIKELQDGLPLSDFFERYR